MVQCFESFSLVDLPLGMSGVRVFAGKEGTVIFWPTTPRHWPTHQHHWNTQMRMCSFITYTNHKHWVQWQVKSIFRVDFNTGKWMQWVASCPVCCIIDVVFSCIWLSPLSCHKSALIQHTGRDVFYFGSLLSKLPFYVPLTRQDILGDTWQYRRSCDVIWLWTQE